MTPAGLAPKVAHPPPPQPVHVMQEPMVRTQDGQLVAQSVLVQRQQEDIQLLRQRLDELSMTHAPGQPSTHIEQRWHPGDSRKAYTWEEFWHEAERQLQHKQKQHVDSDAVTKKATEWWNQAAVA